MEQLGFLIRQNADFKRRIIFPWDMSGCQVHMQSQNTTALNLQTSDGSMTLTNPAGGQVDWDMPAASVGAIVAPPIYPTAMPDGTQAAFLDNYVLSIKWPDGSVTEEMEGPLYIAAAKPF